VQLGFQLSYLINNHEVVRNNSIGVHDTGLVGRVNPEGIRPAAKQLLPKPKAHLLTLPFSRRKWDHIFYSVTFFSVYPLAFFSVKRLKHFRIRQPFHR